jgi:hypothetical protein
MLDYNKLIERNPYVYVKFTNSLGQEIEFVEHPIKGDTYPVICVCHNLKLAASSDFYETVDMLADHKEYEPKFIDGKFWIGDFLHD